MIDSVLLIRPYSISKKEFPVGLLYVGTALKNKGYRVKIIDLQDEPKVEDKVIEILSKSPNMILGISALAMSYRWLKEFTLKLKKISPQTLVVVGGHIAIAYEILLSKTGVDYVCLGEGEETFSELIEKINKQESVNDVRGIAYKNNDQIIKTDFRPFLKEFLIPDYSLVDADRYFIHPTEDRFFAHSTGYKEREKKDDKLAVIMFSRGCIGGCRFCYRHLPGFRQGSIDWSFKHLLLLYNQFGVRYFRFDDELFTNSPGWFEEFCQKLKDSNLNILFRITGLRADMVNDHQLKMLKEIGCIAINYGIESGSQKILNNMNKQTTVEQNLAVLKKTKSYGLQVMAYIMLGYEGEDKKTLNETMSLLLESGLEPKYISLFYTVALPGTQLYKNCLANGKIKDEEKYLEDLAPYVEEEKKDYERYIINLSDTTISNLIKFERILPRLIKLKKILKNQPKIFEVLRRVIFNLPVNDSFFKFLSNLKRISQLTK